MVEAFLWGVVRFGFQHANVRGVDEDWQPLANPAHLSNIRVWLHLIMREPKWCSTLFSALIIHLKLSGTCVKDTDLFQRASVQPVVDFNQLEIVLIITNFRPVETGPLVPTPSAP